jgi:hypothetical protein
MHWCDRTNTTIYSVIVVVLADLASLKLLLSVAAVPTYKNCELH